MKSKVSIISLFFFLISLYPQNGIRVISSDFNSILIEYTPVYNDTLEQVINNVKYKQIELLGGFISSPEDWGAPQVPEYIFNIGVPSEFGNTIEVLNTQYKELKGKIIPKPKMVKAGSLNGFVYEVSEKYYEEPSSEIVTFGNFGIARRSKIQGIKILPVKFYADRDEIKLYTKILFKINFSSSQLIAKKPADEFLSNTILNYQVAQYWGEDKKLSKIATGSVLANGTWFKFETPDEGIYKITRDMLQSFGIDPNSVDPRTIKIYNNGGKMLPEDAAAQRPVDLVENAIWVIGEEDGRFDNGDYILFYGRGNNFWDYDPSSRSVKRFFHYYSKANYYLITSGGTAGKRVQNKPGLNQTPGLIQSSTKAFVSWDVDKINACETGRIFVGDIFSESSTSRPYLNTLDGRLDNFPIQYKWRFINASSNEDDSSDPLPLRVYENSTQIYSTTISGIGIYDLAMVNNGSATFSSALPENQSMLRFEITPVSSSSEGYLDFFEISYQKELKAFNNSITFFSQDTSAVIEYRLSNFSSTNIKVFDVTDYSNVRFITDHIMLSGGECIFQASEIQGAVSKYIAVGDDNFKTPVNPVAVENSNIRGITDGAKFIIITHKNFMEAAQRLKSYRENEALLKLSTTIIDIDNIYNEFSGGILDVSGIRDFLRHAFNTWQITPEYVLFFGSGNYDYKNIEGYNTNFVPTYETESSFHEISSYASDDFFVKIDGGNNDKIDFAVGRITAKTLDEANDFVSKIIEYETQSPNGLWRNRITFVADDGYTSKSYEGSLHTGQSEALSNLHTPRSFDLNKIYMAAYPVVLTGAGKRMPAVNQAIIDAINEGALIINYIGHGSRELWAHEVVFDRNITIPQLHNDKYFFLVAATCSFGYFDIPNFRSASEDILFLKNAGCITTLTASRAVFSTDNAAMSYIFFDYLLKSQRDSLNLPITVGEALFLTKQSDIREDNLAKYHILGDPTLRLKIPQYTAEIDSVNGQTLTIPQGGIQLRALGNVSIEGTIRKPDGTLREDFNGEGILTVFDSERSVLLGQINYKATIPGGLIFRGRVSVVNGRFSVDFVVPKDISYENENGKIVVYFFDEQSDGLGFTSNVIVGGTDSTAVNDGAGPEIEIYFDEVSDQNSYLINPDSRIIVKLQDETGINTTGTGVGHKLEGILNNNENNPIDFTNYFTGNLNTGGKSGEINYRFSNLEPGDYSLKVNGWDIFNNFSTETSYFTVVNGNELVIGDVYNYPNPFSSNTTFTFQHNLSSVLELKIKVYTIAGRLIKEIEKSNVSDKFVTVEWDGNDEDGDPIANGTYLYKIVVRTPDSSFNKSVLGKLAVIR